jgi:2-keto-4-pentenoate hydratase/2-oxohepta-3-ene-1,7-dioic acid hydratase in catechol pathway
MRFARIQHQDRLQLVIVSDDGQRFKPAADVFDLPADDLVELIAQGGRLPAVDLSDGAALDLATLAAPMTPRRNIFCVGKNYHEHASEFSRSGFDSSAQEEIPQAPIIFTKAPSTVTGPFDAVPSHPGVTEQLDYEAELAVVIGRPGLAIKREDALSHVWGYTIVNDFTARDLQKKHRQWFLGKSLDGFCPMGPWVVTADAIDLASMQVQCWINGELRQSAPVNDLIFDIPTLIETISAGIELQPGDIIATGTPAGVGIGFTPPKFVQRGDTMRIAISGIGEIENKVH